MISRNNKRPSTYWLPMATVLMTLVMTLTGCQSLRRHIEKNGNGTPIPVFTPSDVSHAPAANNHCYLNNEPPCDV